MTATAPSDEEIRELLLSTKTIAIVGVSANTDRSEIEQEIDLVDVFRKPADCLAVLDEAIAIKAKSVWLQLGISVPEVKSVGEAAGLSVIMDRCIKIDHAHLLK